MAEVILMPRLSDTMTEGVIAAWHKKVGEPVRKGELLAEVETDKATMDLESYKDGTLLYVGTDKGGKIQVNDLLAIIGAPGEDISSLVKGGGQAASPAPAAAKADKAAAPVAAPAVAPAAGGGLDLSKEEAVILMPPLRDTITEEGSAAWPKKGGAPGKTRKILTTLQNAKTRT